MKSLALLIGTAMLVTQAWSIEPADGPQVQVSYADLSLDTPEGLHKLLGRLESAAKSVCASGSESYRRVRPVNQACEDKALSGAIAQIGDQRVARYVAGRRKVRNG